MSTFFYVLRVRTYFALKSKFTTAKIIMAPKAPVNIAPKRPLPKLTPVFPNTQEPTKLPKSPATMLPIKPKLLPLKICAPSQPATAPINNVVINSINN